jgi:DNA-binding MarR family transcriptional regulator
MDSSNRVLVLDDLEDLEFVERRRNPADRRRHIVDITGRPRSTGASGGRAGKQRG